MQLVQDWRAFRARLVAMESGQTARATSMQLGREERWAHVLTQPERGCLLVARPRPGLGMFQNTGVSLHLLAMPAFSIQPCSALVVVLNSCVL